MLGTCREVTELVASGSIERLGAMARLKVRLHLLVCVHCRRYAKQLRTIAERMRAHANAEAPADPAALQALEDEITRSACRRPPE